MGYTLTPLHSIAHDVYQVGKFISDLVHYTTIQAAIDTAAATGPTADSPATVYINSGYYNESLVCADYVNLKGLGPTGSVIIYQDDATILTMANIQIDNVTIRLNTPTGARNLIIDNGVAITASFTDVDIKITTPGAYNHNIFLFSGASDIDMLNLDAHPDGSGASNVISVTGAAHIQAEHCDFNNDSTNSACATINCAATGALVEVDNSDIFAQNGRSVDCGAGIVLMRTVHYHSVYRHGTGNVIDHSEYIVQYIWHMFTMAWDVVSGNANINRGTGSGGAINDGGTGQVVLSTGATVSDYAWIGNNTDVTGALASTFNPQRTPRYCVQFSANIFEADTYMFFGLRTTQPTTIPTTENHVGFIWDGTNFKTSNADGSTQVTHILTTPAANQQHQLDILTYGGVKIEFYVDGQLVVTETTYLPTGELQFQDLLYNDGTTPPASAAYVTIRRMSCHECPS